MGRLQNNPSIGLVHPKYTHAHPLAWGNNKGYFIFNFIYKLKIEKKGLKVYPAPPPPPHLSPTPFPLHITN
jgi:hypothetical protein